MKRYLKNNHWMTTFFSRADLLFTWQFSSHRSSSSNFESKILRVILCVSLDSIAVNAVASILPKVNWPHKLISYFLIISATVYIGKLVLCVCLFPLLTYLTFWNYILISQLKFHCWIWSKNEVWLNHYLLQETVIAVYRKYNTVS